MTHFLEFKITPCGFLLWIFAIHSCFLITSGSLIYYARRPQKLVLEELAREEGIMYDSENVPLDPDANSELSEVEQFPNCTSFDAIRCCVSATNLPCSEFIKNPYFKDVCGEECGIPCVDDITTDNDIGVIVEASEAECIDDKPPVCCDFLRNNHLCRTELYRGCPKTCEICSANNATDTQPPTDNRTKTTTLLPK